MTRIRVIQIGVGGFGRSWLEILRDFPGVELAALVDVSEEKLREAEAILGPGGEATGEDSPIRVPGYRSTGRALREVEADIAVIVTPAGTHRELALAALEAGLHVLMEKPLAESYDEALELREGAARFRTRLMISQNYRYKQEILALKKAIASGAVGQPEHIEYSYRMLLNPESFGWRDEFDEVFLVDMAVHHFDLLRYLTGREPRSVYARTLHPSWSNLGGNPTAACVIEFEDGPVVSYSGTWAAWGGDTTWNGELRAYGSEGAVELINDRPYLVAPNGGRSRLTLPEVEHPSRGCCLAELIRALEEERRPETDIEDNIRTFAAVCAATRSASSGERVNIDPDTGLIV